MSDLIDKSKLYDDMLSEMSFTGYQSRALNVISRQPTIDAIPMSDDLELMLSSAVRYALGRRTYIVSTTCNFITCCLDKLSERTLYVIKRDIEERRDMGDEYLGDECDRMNWINLLDRIQNRLLMR